MKIRYCTYLLVICVFYIGEAWRGLSLPRIRCKSSSRHHASLAGDDDGEGSLKLSKEVRECTGPMSLRNNMNTGWGLDELGVDLFIGPSAAALGKGLFVALQSDVEEALIPLLTVICGYGKGDFVSPAQVVGDKGVDFAFHATDGLVVFNKQIRPLHEVIEQVASQVQPTSNFTSLVAGHILKISASTGMQISPDKQNRMVFIPNESLDLTLASAGMYANDLAFSPMATENTYNIDKHDKNFIGLLWRVEFDGTCVQPTWPVVITYSDLAIRSHEPIELGISYSWGWWEFRKNGGK